MKVTLLAVGRMRGPAAELAADYEARARRYFSFETIEVASEPARGEADAERVRRVESARLRERVAERAVLVALDRRGRPWSSRELARYIADAALAARTGISFVIGGAFGLSEELLGGAARRWSLSALTLPHDLARIVVLEQLYRAGTIARGEPYHKGRDG